MVKTCENCGHAFHAQRAVTKTCSPACRQALSVRNKAGKNVATLPAPSANADPAEPAFAVIVLRNELDAAGVLDTYEAENAIGLATIAADPGQPAAARVSAAKEARAAKAAALAAKPVADTMDEVTRKRDEKLRRARGS